MLERDEVLSWRLERWGRDRPNLYVQNWYVEIGECQSAFPNIKSRLLLSDQRCRNWHRPRHATNYQSAYDHLLRFSRWICRQNCQRFRTSLRSCSFNSSTWKQNYSFLGTFLLSTSIEHSHSGQTDSVLASQEILSILQQFWIKHKR